MPSLDLSSPLHSLSLGDSYTIGEGVAAGERWPEQLAVRLRAEGWSLPDPWIIARTGWTTSELSAAIDSAAPGGVFDLVTLLIGVNDQYRGWAVEGYRLRFRDLLTRSIAFAGGRAKRVIVLSIPDWGVTPFAVGRDRPAISAQIDAFNQINAEETRRAGASYVDITPLSRRAAQNVHWLVEDQLHPSAAMYAAWVELVLPAARAALSG